MVFGGFWWDKNKIRMYTGGGLHKSFLRFNFLVWFCGVSLFGVVSGCGVRFVVFGYHVLAPRIVHSWRVIVSKKARVLLVRLAREDLLRAGGGVVVKVVVTHSNMKVLVEDDLGGKVEYGRAELTGEDLVVR